MTNQAFSPVWNSGPLVSTNVGSTRTAFGNTDDPVIEVFNDSVNTLYFKQGSSTVVATTNDFPVLPGRSAFVLRTGTSVNGMPTIMNFTTHFACISAAGTTNNTVISTGTGNA